MVFLARLFLEFLEFTTFKHILPKISFYLKGYDYAFVPFFSACIYLVGNVVSMVFVKMDANMSCTKPFSYSMWMQVWLLVKVGIESSSDQCRLLNIKLKLPFQWQRV